MHTVTRLMPELCILARLRTVLAVNARVLNINHTIALGFDANHLASTSIALMLSSLMMQTVFAQAASLAACVCANRGAAAAGRPQSTPAREDRATCVCVRQAPGQSCWPHAGNS